MLRGLYTAASGMVTQQLKEENIANNLVNANTPGYKRHETVLKSFPEVLLWRLGNGDREKIGKVANGTLIDETVTIHQPGPVEETGRALDFALIGKGYFRIETPQGIRYTKNGHFRLNSEGYLVTEAGCFVLGRKGRIKLGTEDIKVNEQGNIVVDGRTVDRLDIARLHNPGSLVKEGNSLFRATADTVEDADVPVTVRQHMLEKSNVNLIKEMVDMMAVLRSFEANQKVVQAYDQVLEMSARDIGSLR
ncbi:MAG: flagellar basal-body rod protein FlgF [Thermoanaerobacteraceae bacterium]|nr:flagellar basal-body rod protein FlgF [Thermoanaerobacteraceae bacterium]